MPLEVFSNPRSERPLLVADSAKVRLLNSTVNATPKSRATGRFNPFPEGARARPGESLSESNMVHGTGQNGACHLPC
jgi:hypothetical protein